MPKRALAHACFTGIAVVLGLSASGCTTRGAVEAPDAYVVIPIPDAAGLDAGPRSDAPVVDARGDGGGSADVGGACGARDLHSDVGASVATGSTATGTDRHAPACGSGSAPDAWFTWTSPAGGMYAFDTSGSSFDTVLDVLSGCSGGSLACNDDGPAGLTSLATVTLGPRQTVVIVIDGLRGESGDFVLGIHAVVPEICTDSIDNDGDGDADCADYADCGSLPACMESGARCADGLDNDGDLDVDCSDFDCWGEPACTETICDDGLDNDSDLSADCEDYDCRTFPACDESMHCDDGLDNDADFDTDCADYDCSAFPACDESTHCADGLDNDADSDVDCADYDCRTFATCDESTQCADNVDNDHDDDVDCADADCSTAAGCATPEANCDDGLDDDRDGAIDCTDTDCDARCTESTVPLCMNSMDDDGDALVDCADRQCSCSAACPPAVPPPTTCPDADLGSALGDGVFHGTITPYACGARADSGCGSGGNGGEIELAWKAPAAGSYTFDTNDTSRAGGTFDTVISLRTDCTAGATELDCNDDGGTGRLSSMSTTLTANQTVVIVIDAYAIGDGGNVTLNIHAD